MRGRLGAVAVVVALAAIAFAISAATQSKRPNIHMAAAAIPVALGAQKQIQEGTAGDVIRTTRGFYRAVHVASGKVAAGAIVDPSRLTGKFAAKNIPAGQQLTVADFAPVSHVIPITPGGLRRAVVIKPSNQIGGQITAGSRVDVWVAATGQASTRFRAVDRNMLVLAVSTSDGTVTLRAMRNQVGKLVYAAANHRLVVRPHQ